MVFESLTIDCMTRALAGLLAIKNAFKTAALMHLGESEIRSEGGFGEFCTGITSFDDSRLLRKSG